MKASNLNCIPSRMSKSFVNQKYKKQLTMVDILLMKTIIYIPPIHNIVIYVCTCTYSDIFHVSYTLMEFERWSPSQVKNRLCLQSSIHLSIQTGRNSSNANKSMLIQIQFWTCFQLKHMPAETWTCSTLKPINFAIRIFSLHICCEIANDRRSQ